MMSYSLPLMQSKKMEVYALGSYDGPLRSLLLAKNSGAVMPFCYLAGLLAERYSTLFENADGIVPIPLHWTRRWRRGFNQAEVLAYHIAQKVGIKRYMILSRVRRTSFQASLPQSLRVNNVKNAFCINRVSDDIYGKKIILVDDLMTTGSTLAEAARQLVPYKPREIHALVVARATT